MSGMNPATSVTLFRESCVEDASDIELKHKFLIDHHGPRHAACGCSRNPSGRRAYLHWPPVPLFGRLCRSTRGPARSVRSICPSRSKWLPSQTVGYGRCQQMLRTCLSFPAHGTKLWWQRCTQAPFDNTMALSTFVPLPLWRQASVYLASSLVRHCDAFFLSSSQYLCSHFSTFYRFPSLL